MKNRKACIIIFFIVLGALISCNEDLATESGQDSEIFLLPEDQVRLSNDPDKTELFFTTKCSFSQIITNLSPNSGFGRTVLMFFS